MTEIGLFLAAVLGAVIGSATFIAYDRWKERRWRRMWEQTKREDLRQ